MEKRLTLSVPSYLRPQRTIRAINCIANQNTNDWEALVIGDGCPVMQDFIDSHYFSDIVTECKSKGNDLLISNNSINKGGHGYVITNKNIQFARGKYFMFYANDDIILPNHFENYLSQIEGTDFDFVYFNSFVKPNNSIRNSSLQYGSIGHSELIIKTDFLNRIPQHDAEYGHDWALIQNMINAGGKNKKSSSPEITYHVMSLSDNREKYID